MSAGRRPGPTASASPPAREATTGMPLAPASRATSPNGSSTTARARPTPRRTGRRPRPGGSRPSIRTSRRRRDPSRAACSATAPTPPARLRSARDREQRRPAAHGVQLGERLDSELVALQRRDPARHHHDRPSGSSPNLRRTSGRGRRPPGVNRSRSTPGGTIQVRSAGVPTSSMSTAASAPKPR